MPRKIKFRAWKKKGFSDQYVMTYDNEDESSDYWDGAVNSEVGMVNYLLEKADTKWMQFTGLKDKNGKMLFESDTVKGYQVFNKQEVEGEIVWDKGSWKVGNQWLELCDVELTGNKYEGQGR